MLEGGSMLAPEHKYINHQVAACWHLNINTSTSGGRMLEGGSMLEP